MIFAADVENYHATHALELTFFDRSAVDALGMLNESGAMSEAEIEQNLRQLPYNSVAFALPPWEAIYQTDSERDQSFAEAMRVFESVCSWYTRCGYTLVEVPVGSVSERADFVEAAVAARGQLL